MITIPKIHKPPKLKPLALGDIMVALINQQNTVDRTQQYKKMFNQSIATAEQITFKQQDVELPQFAQREYTQQQILDFHIKNKLRDTSHSEAALKMVDKRIKIAILQYGDKVKEGEKSMQDLIILLNQMCRRITENRKCLNSCTERLNKSYSKVVPTLRRISNIKKVIEILSVWGQSKIPYLFSVDLAQPYLYQISQVLDLFQNAKRKIQNNPSLKHSASLQKIFSSLAEKQSLLIANVCSQFTNSVITYKTNEQYKQRFVQYLFIMKKQLCNNVLSIEGTKQIIQLNAKSLFVTVLQKYNSNKNVDLLNQNLYVDFYEELIEDYVIYFRNWHYVTTFHIDNQTSFAFLYLETRKHVFTTFCDQIGRSIENSKKFLTLEYGTKLKLVERLQDYMDAGQKWMGSYQSIQLPKIVVGKITMQLSKVFSLYNSLIKNILSQQISVSSLQVVDQAAPLRKIKIQTLSGDINYDKVSLFLCSNKKQHLDGIEKTHTEIPPLPEVRLKVGQIFGQMITEYFQRSKYLQSNKSIYIVKIYEHFQFILYMLYQVGVRDSIKNQLNLRLLEELKSENQISEEKSAVSIKKLNQLSKVSIFKRKYIKFLEFLDSCGSKYLGTRVAGIIDVNKVYDSNNPDYINGYMKIVIRVVGDLQNILKWLVDALPHTQLKNYRQCAKISKLQDVLKELFCLIVENKMVNLYNRYIQVLSPIITKLSWSVKKFNQEVANQYKQYKMKILQTFRNNTLIFIVKSQAKQLFDMVTNLEVETLYRSLLQCYGKIQKINDNGRQIIRMDCVDVTRILSEFSIKSQAWSKWLDQYLDITVERNCSNVLNNIKKVGILYEMGCWRFDLMWIMGDLNTKQKKSYNSGLAQIYVEYLRF